MKVFIYTVFVLIVLIPIAFISNRIELKSCNTGIAPCPTLGFVALLFLIPALILLLFTAGLYWFYKTVNNRLLRISITTVLLTLFTLGVLVYYNLV